METKLGRRVVLTMIGSAPLVAYLPACSDDDTEVVPKGSFFTVNERLALGALANVVLPDEPSAPGGAKLGAVPYIERLLTAFDFDPPVIFADGPYSNRKFFSSGGIPKNDFARFMRLDRVTEHAWRIRLYGSKATPNGTLNDPLVPPVVGLRSLFKDGLASALRGSDGSLHTQSPEQIAEIYRSLDAELQTVLIDLVGQAAFGAPEYGGNPELAGWQLAHFEGDTQPLGYSIFDTERGEYVERPEAPMSTAETAPDPAPLDEGTRALLKEVVSFTGGKVFP